MNNTLWNALEADSIYRTDNALYINHVIEQYKIYVEMADRISARRNLANVFFLTLHSLCISTICFFIEKVALISPKWIMFFPFFIVIMLCLTWWWTLTSYRNLNSAKYKVIGQLEEKLPSSPYWSAEWKELGEGKDIKKYLPITTLEQYVPILFAIVYSLLGGYILFFQ